MKRLYHATTQKKARRYRENGKILKPVRGFTTLMAAMAWCIKTHRTVIYEIDLSKIDERNIHKLPDHHNKFGEAWWIDEDVPVSCIKCVLSANNVEGEIVSRRQ